MTGENIAEILEYEAKATPGPWTSAHQNHACLISAGVHAEGAKGIRIFSSTEATRAITANSDNDADFAARARTDLPEAMREIQRLRGTLGEFNQLLRCSKGHIHNRPYGNGPCPLCEVEELRKDKERLDWLKEKGIYIDVDEVSKQLQYTVCNVSAEDLASGFSIRAAIDAARESAK